MTWRKLLRDGGNGHSLDILLLLEGLSLISVDVKYLRRLHSGEVDVR